MSSPRRPALLTFGQLSACQCAFVDITSLALLAQYRVELETPLENKAQERFIRQKAAETPFRTALCVVERLVAYDFLAYDQWAGQVLRKKSLAGELPNLGLLVRPVAIPDAVYHETERRIYAGELAEFSRFLDSQSGELAALSHPAFTPQKKFYDGLDEDYFDEAYRQGLVHRFAETSSTPERLLFYLEVSSAAGVPVFLSPWKDGQFQLYIKSFRAYLKDHQEYLQQVESALQHELLRQDGELFQAMVPPLSGYILETAIREKTSLLAAALALRETGPARAFREWLGGIQRDLLSGSNAAQFDASRRRAEFDKIVQQWAATYDLKLGVAYRKIALTLGLTLGTPNTSATVSRPVGLPVKILRKPLYLSFITSWFDKG